VVGKGTATDQHARPTAFVQQVDFGAPVGFIAVAEDGLCQRQQAWVHLAHFLQVLGQALLQVQPQHLGGGGVAGAQPKLAIQGQHAGREMLEHGFQVAALGDGQLLAALGGAARAGDAAGHFIE
jgi:hypothetical protein